MGAIDIDPPVASLSLTHVHYGICASSYGRVALTSGLHLTIYQDPTDPISHLCAFLALVPQGLIVAYVVLCWSSREVEILMAFAGQLACEALNFALKRIIREERPLQIRGKGYGMPSSHSQFMAFFAVYIGLFVLVRHQPKPRRGSGQGREGAYGILSAIVPSQYVQQILTAILISANAGMVAASRIYLNYHTPKQVFVGCGAGATFAILWYLLTAAVRSSGLIDWALGLLPARLFRLRDLLLDEDLVESGYREYMDRRSSRPGPQSASKKSN